MCGWSIPTPSHPASLPPIPPNPPPSGDVRWNEGSPASMDGITTMANPLGERTKIKVTVPKWPGKWVVSMDEYKDGVVGAKSKNLAGLRGKLPDWIALPSSVTLPFGCFEEVLRATKQNKEIEKELDALVKTVNLQNADTVLTKARDLAMRVEVPDKVVEDVGKAMGGAGITVPGSTERWGQALTALKVWSGWVVFVAWGWAVVCCCTRDIGVCCCCTSTPMHTTCARVLIVTPQQLVPTTGTPLFRTHSTVRTGCMGKQIQRARLHLHAQGGPGFHGHSYGCPMSTSGTCQVCLCDPHTQPHKRG